MAQLEVKNNKPIALDDEQRVKVLSPNMMVLKRFFRNRLAVVGLIILAAMFIFSFVGGVLNPYPQDEVFRRTELAIKDYAGASVNDNWKYELAEGAEFPKTAQPKAILAINKGEGSFEADGVNYLVVNLTDNDYLIASGEQVATLTTIGAGNITSGSLTEAEKAAYDEARANDASSFNVDGESYTISTKGRIATVFKAQGIAIITKNIFTPAAEDAALSFEFKQAAIDAQVNNLTEITADGKTYRAEEEKNGMLFFDGEKEYALISNYSISPVADGVFLSLDFRNAVLDAIEGKQESFTFADENGEEVEYHLENKNTEYKVRKYEETVVNDKYSAPSAKHWLGTDGHGMDLLSRLMYGGRISLLVGFVVVIIELVIGVILGGLAGYFGGWVDTVVMRMVDICYCIPSMPVFIIIGSIMDFNKVDPQYRIFVLCLMLGFLGWAGIARMVRGQILSLREQEFMVAAEALGISVKRRIFVHLIPNVIPQLIVIATMDLGGTILTEATLSFLGLGVKFPYASWGNIINAVTDSYIMQSYLFVWIPAGILILLTVLGFNFIGDGLRDAFDPKMKR